MTEQQEPEQHQAEAHAAHGHAAHEHAAGEHAAEPGQPEDRQAWNERYSGSARVWSGQPNTALVEQAAELAPGRALDLGCGEGADSVWLAGRGWKVTAVDVSDVALERAAGHAADAGVADAVQWQRRDLVADFPPGEYDLVSAQFLYPRDREPAAREGILRSAARAVAPGGVLLIESHAGFPAWEQGKHSAHAGMVFLKPQELLDSLLLEPAQWEVLVCAEHDRVQNDPEGRPSARTDSTLKLRRVDAP
jgi:SAM-dependent methyltransferase